MDAIADKRDTAARRHDRTAACLPRLLQRHARHQAARSATARHLLAQAEEAARAFADDDAALADHLARLDDAWDDLLFTEFHDILTGTSIPSAWDSVRAMQGRARIAGEEVIYEATRRWSYRALPRVDEQQIVVINTGETPFAGYVEAEPYLDFDDWSDRWISDENGRRRSPSSRSSRNRAR